MMVVYVNVDDCNDIISERKYNELRESVPDDIDEAIESADWALDELIEKLYHQKDKDFYAFGKAIFEAVQHGQEWIIERQYQPVKVED